MPARSRWLVGSSSSSTSGSAANARAIAARRLSPPQAVAAGRSRSRPIWSAIASTCVRGASARQREVPQRREPGHRRILLEQHHLDPRLDRPPPLVGLDHVGEAFEQGRLPRPVAPDQRQPVALADEQVEPAEQPARALDQAEIFISEDGRGHGGPDRDSIAARHPVNRFARFPRDAFSGHSPFRASLFDQNAQRGEQDEAVSLGPPLGRPAGDGAAGDDGGGVPRKGGFARAPRHDGDVLQRCAAAQGRDEERRRRAQGGAQPLRGQPASVRLIARPTASRSNRATCSLISARSRPLSASAWSSATHCG